MGGEGWGHSVLRLMNDLSTEITVPAVLLDDAKQLDKLYIPTRYPNGFEQGAPGDYYSARDSHEAISSAGRVLEFCREGLSRS